MKLNRKMKRTVARAISLALFLSGTGCMKKEVGEKAVASPKPAGPGGWLKGDTDQKFNTLARQMRGFDVAMVEAGYRYIELYWAGREGNWDFARYQADKIGTALRDGLERRPNRATSAVGFMGTALPNTVQAIARKDTALFRTSFQALTASCNACHALENVGFVQVAEPLDRISPVRSR